MVTRVKRARDPGEDRGSIEHVCGVTGEAGVIAQAATACRRPHVASENGLKRAVVRDKHASGFVDASARRNTPGWATNADTVRSPISVSASQGACGPHGCRGLAPRVTTLPSLALQSQ